MAAGPGWEDKSNFSSHFHLFQYHSVPPTQFDARLQFLFEQHCEEGQLQQLQLHTDVIKQAALIPST